VSRSVDDARQGDLFALLEPQLPAAHAADRWRKVRAGGIEHEQRVAEAEAAAEAEHAARPVERIELGNCTPKGKYNIIPHGQPHCILEIVSDGEQFGWRYDYALKNGGGCGPARFEFDTAAAARIDALRAKLNQWARYQFGWGSDFEANRKAAAMLAADAIKQFPPMLLDGEDLAAYWSDAVAAERADHEAMLAGRELIERIGKDAGAALDALGIGAVRVGPGVSQQGFICAPTDPGESHTGQMLGWWWLEGHVERTIFLTIGQYDKYPNDPAFARAIEALQAANLPVTIRSADRLLTHYGQRCAFGWVRYGSKRRAL
jgi:hypothetical protein